MDDKTEPAALTWTGRHDQQATRADAAEAEVARLSALLREAEERKKALLLFLASDVARAAGYMQSVAAEPIVPGDCAADYLERIAALLNSEGDKLHAALLARLQEPRT